jgi:hypothetical protein
MRAIQNVILEKLWDLCAKQVQTEPVNGADIHFCHTDKVRQPLTAPIDHALLKLGRRLFGDDIARPHTHATVGGGREQFCYVLRYDLGLAGYGTSDELQISLRVIDRNSLLGGKLHRT